MKRELFVYLLFILALICGVGVSVGYWVGLEQAFTAGLTAALVGVTAVYAWDTARIRKSNEETAKAALEQARASLEMARETRNLADETRRAVLQAARTRRTLAVNEHNWKLFENVLSISGNGTL